MAKINKNTLEYLAGLARIDISGKDEEKLLKDLQKILTHFEELKEVETENVGPMAGGNMFSSNIFREDAQSSKFPEAEQARYGAGKVQSSKLVEQFPEEKDGFLKVPAVFE